MKHLEEYTRRYFEFAKITPMNLEDRLYSIPEEKHYWVTELIKMEYKKRALTKTRKKLKEVLVLQRVENGIVALNKQTLNDLENEEKMVEIDERLADVESAIKYLELIVKNVSFIGNDVKNIISLRQLEEQ